MRGPFPGGDALAAGRRQHRCHLRPGATSRSAPTRSASPPRRAQPGRRRRHGRQRVGVDRARSRPADAPVVRGGSWLPRPAQRAQHEPRVRRADRAHAADRRPAMRHAHRGTVRCLSRLRSTHFQRRSKTYDETSQSHGSATLSFAGCATQAESSGQQSPIMENQGTQLQGVQLQGSQVQGMTLVGFQYAGADARRHRAGQRPHRARRAGRRPGPGHAARRRSGRRPPLRPGPRPGPSVVDRRWSSTGSPRSRPRRRLRVPTGTGATYLYTLEQNVDGAGNWQAACLADSDSKHVAIPLTATWDDHGQPASRRARCSRSAATTGVIGKCYRWGYRPWVNRPGRTWWAAHWTCTRVARADYCLPPVTSHHARRPR